MTRMIDLHVHTSASDGTYSPSGVVALANKAGLAAMAVTDHDTVDGVAEAQAAAEGTGLELVPGIEISVGDTDDVHIIGLYVNIKDSGFVSVMERLKQNRTDRNCEIFKKIRSLGFDVSYEEAESVMDTGNMGRLHIAGYLHRKGIVRDYRKAFKNFLVPGAAAYVPMQHLSEKEGIEAILNSGGLPFLAHINYLKMSDDGVEETVKRLMGYGLAGIEAYYSGYNADDERLAGMLCEKYSLLKSGGTDFHGARRRGVYLGTGRGNMCIKYEVLSAIKEKLR